MVLARTARVWTIGALVLAPWTGVAQDALSYRVLATSKTSTMEKELKAAGAAGHRFVAVTSGETSGGEEVVVLMERRNGDRTKYEYRLLAASKSSTLSKELREASEAGWAAVGQAVFPAVFGGDETVAILERNPARAQAELYEFKLIAATKTATLEEELRIAGGLGFEAVGMTIGKTAFKGSELVVITRRLVR